MWKRINRKVDTHRQGEAFEVEFMRTMWKLINRKADTPITRIGLILLISSVLAWGGTALHWNLARHGFFYRHRDVWIEKSPKPSEDTAGAFWREELYGWGLYDKSCVEADRVKQPSNMLIFHTPPEKCRLKFQPHARKARVEWKQSLTDYFRESFKPRRGDYFWVNVPTFLYTKEELAEQRKEGDYFWVNVPAFFALLLGVFMYSGLADGVLRWIKSGNTKR